MTNIGLIFDSNYEIGGGHFWRCFNLAKLVNKKNCNFFFISNSLNDDFIKILKKNNFNYIKISKLNNTKSLINIFIKLKIEILISDYYKLTNIQKKKLKNYIKYLIVIDDFTNKKHSSDLYINNNFLNKLSIKKIKKLNPKSKLFLGPRYSILDKSFFMTKNFKLKKEKKKEIFCFFGSSDPTDETTKCLKVLKSYNDIKVNVLIGKLNKNYKKIMKKFQYSNNFKFYNNIPNQKVFNILRKSYISIGSGGINMLERLFLGIPSIVICTANNQIDSINNLIKKKFIIFLGNSNQVNPNKINQAIFKLINNEKKVIRLSNRLNLYFNKIKKGYLMSKKLNLTINNIKS